MVIDIAKRAYDKNWKIDPISRSVLDTDFYKLLMAQYIHKFHSNDIVKFSVNNRTKSVKLSEFVTEDEIREQFDFLKTVRLTKSEKLWLAGNTFYGKENIFQSDFLNWLEQYRFPDYTIIKTEDGQFDITFEGSYLDVTLAEVPALSILNELRSRALMKTMSKFELDIMFSRAKTKLWDKIEKLKTLDQLALAEFGTRRRFSFLWQEWVVEALREGLGKSLLGTSNVFLAKKFDMEAIGTNGHEISMVEAALAKNDDELKYSPYKVLENWQTLYEGKLLVMLPDTFGTSSFLRNAPDFVNNWTGARLDSKDPFEAGYEFINWWKSRNVDPQTKLLLWSDGLNVGNDDTTDILNIHREFEGKVRRGYGWGTNATNDFVDCAVNGQDMKPISIVCKVTEVNGKSAVKLSDNSAKFIGSPNEVEKYVNVFDWHGINKQPKV